MNPYGALLLFPTGGLAHLLGRDVFKIDGQPVRVVLGVRHHLGRVQRQDGLGDDGRGFVQKVGVVDPEGLVVPVDFPCDQGLGNEPEGEDDTFDLGSLLVFLREIGLLVAATRTSTGAMSISATPAVDESRLQSLDSHRILPQPLRGRRPAPVLGDTVRPQGRGQDRSTGFQQLWRGRGISCWSRLGRSGRGTVVLTFSILVVTASIWDMRSVIVSIQFGSGGEG